MKARKWCLWLHLWLGLIAGLLVSVIGVSGSALVFRPEIEDRVFPQWMLVEAQVQRASWQALLQSVQRQFPDDAVQHIFVARDDRHSHEFWLRDGDLRVYVDGYTSKVLGSREPQSDWFGWLIELHTDLLGGETGHNIVGIGGVSLILLGISGLVLWWPRGRWKSAFAMHWKTNWKGRIYELHRVGGALACGGLMMIALAGSGLVWSAWFAATLATATGNAPKAKPKIAKSASKVLSLDELVKNADAAFGGRLSRISFPAKSGAPLIIRKKLPADLHPNGVNYLYLDPRSGRVLRVDAAARAAIDGRLMNARYPLHIGLWGGSFSMLTRILHALLGLMPLGLFISGLVMWWNRQQRIRGSKRRKVVVRDVVNSTALMP